MIVVIILQSLATIIPIVNLRRRFVMSLLRLFLPHYRVTAASLCIKCIVAATLQLSCLSVSACATVYHIINDAGTVEAASGRAEQNEEEKRWRSKLETREKGTTKGRQ